MLSHALSAQHVNFQDANSRQQCDASGIDPNASLASADTGGKAGFLIKQRFVVGSQRTTHLMI